jgi:hypothetical protein
MTCPSHLPWLDHSNYTRSWRIVEVQINSEKLKNIGYEIAKADVGNTHKTNQQKWRERRQHIDFWKHIITL